MHALKKQRGKLRKNKEPCYARLLIIVRFKIFCRLPYCPVTASERNYFWRKTIMKMTALYSGRLTQSHLSLS